MATLASMETEDPKKTVCKCLTLARVLQTYQVSPCNVHQYGSSTLNSLRWGANILTCVFNSPCVSHNAEISEYMECQKGDPSPTCFWLQAHTCDDSPLWPESLKSEKQQNICKWLVIIPCVTHFLGWKPMYLSSYSTLKYSTNWFDICQN